MFREHGRETAREKGKYGICPLISGITTYPVQDGQITSQYGVPRPGHVSGHGGVDIVSSTGNKNVYASDAGKIVAAGPAKGYGNWVVVQSKASDGSTYWTIYGHVNTDSQIKTGDNVNEGQLLGQYANIGSASRGAHLHYELRIGSWQQPKKDNRIDPNAHLKDADAPVCN